MNVFRQFLAIMVALSLNLVSAHAAPSFVEPTACSSLISAKPYLYKIEKNGKATYILGTIHLGVSLNDLPKWVNDKIAASDVLVTEIQEPTTFLGKAFLQFRMLAGMFNFSGQKLGDQLTPSEFRKLAERLIKRNIPAGSVDSMSPALAYILFSVDPEKLKDGKLDEEVKAYADKCGLKSTSFETASFQLSMLKKTCTIETLKAALASEEAPDSDMTLNATNYKRGDEALMLHQYEEAQQRPEFFSGMLVDRNEAWVPQINKFQKGKKTYFIAVGALHLFGEKGVLALLKAEGYQISRVTGP